MQGQIDALENKKCNFIVICENEKLVGILFYWNYDDSRYIEHIAITKKLRGKNYCSKILTEFCA